MQARITAVGLVMQPDPAELFEYPAHIDRASLDALPARPGIYIFRGEHDQPLYVGKSVNIRSRVLSHLRTPQEARMLQQSRYVEFRRSAGEIGALLMESQLIKQLQPLHNVKLRRTREMCTLCLDAAGMPEVVYARDHDFSRTQGLYGLFATRKSALEKLRAIVEMARLCPALSGLEKVSRGRACFARQIARCFGACIGEETVEDHAARLRAALEEYRLMVWPYPGPMAIVEECDGWRQAHVIDHWFYIGSTDALDKASTLTLPARRSFDADTYKILVKPMLHGELLIKPPSACEA